MAPRLIAVLLLGLSLLPIANLIPGGEEDLGYAARMLDWSYGLGLCVGLGLLVAFVVRARSRALVRSGERTSVDTGERASKDDLDGGLIRGSAGAGFITVAALLSLALYALVAIYVFSGRPVTVDEVVQVLQGRWYAEGRLFVPTPSLREFFSILHLVDIGDRTFGQFPAGGPAMLAIGTLIGAEWIVGPMVGAASVVLFGNLLAWLEPSTSRLWHRVAVTLFALAPFGVFMFGSHMNHATALVWLLGATVALARCTSDESTHPFWGLAAGVALGAAATIRPVDAAAFAIPAAAWLLWRARGGGRPLATLLFSGLGVALPLSLLFWVNSQTTGHPLLFGYDLLWGPGHGLGFHESPWGPIHSPSRGLELISLYFTRLSVYLFETPFPALLPAAGALWLTRELRPLDRYLLVTAGLVVVGYWAYWHDGFYLGPRFMFPLLPVLVLWSARFPLLLRARLVHHPLAMLGLSVAIAAGVAGTVVSLVFVRGPQYRNGFTSMRVDFGRESERAGVIEALVLVKESWGAQLMARMWGLGITRSDAEVIYGSVDACKLELTLGALERTGVRGAAARDRFLPLQADSALLVRSPRSPDFTERFLPGYAYAPVCEWHIAEDVAGYSHLAPLRLARDGNIYARWIPGRESDIAAQFPGRPVYLLKRADNGEEAPLVWQRLSR